MSFAHLFLWLDVLTCLSVGLSVILYVINSERNLAYGSLLDFAYFYFNRFFPCASLFFMACIELVYFF